MRKGKGESKPDGLGIRGVDYGTATSSTSSGSPALPPRSRGGFPYVSSTSKSGQDGVGTTMVALYFGLLIVTIYALVGIAVGHWAVDRGFDIVSM